MVLKKTKKPTESYWKKVEQQALSLVTNSLNLALPFQNWKDLDIIELERDSDWNELWAGYEINYSEGNFPSEKLPESKDLAQEISYEYLLLVVGSLLRSLSRFECHDSSYFEGLTEIE